MQLCAGLKTSLVFSMQGVANLLVGHPLSHDPRPVTPAGVRAFHILSSAPPSSSIVSPHPSHVVSSGAPAGHAPVSPSCHQVPLLGMLLIWIFGDPGVSTFADNIGWSWRVLLGLGALPGA